VKNEEKERGEKEKATEFQREREIKDCEDRQMTNLTFDEVTFTRQLGLVE
jgi:hypothetical protein